MRIVSLLNIASSDPATKVAATNIRPSKRAQRSIAFVVHVHVAFCCLLGGRARSYDATQNRPISRNTKLANIIDDIDGTIESAEKTEPAFQVRASPIFLRNNRFASGQAPPTRKNDVPIEWTTKERKPRLPVPSYSLVKPGKISQNVPSSRAFRAKSNRTSYESSVSLLFPFD